MDSLKDVVDEGMAFLQGRLRGELDAQGHAGTGRLSRSIDYKVEASEGRAVARMYFEDHGVFVEFGVRASRIPYGGRKRGKTGGTSLYIEGLVKFWQGRGLQGREATRAAFATARVHSREGMPTRASHRFSSTGRRTGFVRDALNGAQKELTELLAAKFAALVEIRFDGGLFAGQQNVVRYEVGI